MSELQIGFIGLGQMGAGMARNILLSGRELMVYDHVKTSVHELESIGASSASSAKEIGEKCNVVILCLPQAPEIEDVLFGGQGLLAGRCQSLCVLDASTIDRTDAQEFSARCNALDVTYCDCPVSGLPKRASDGTLTVMFGGARSDFERVEEVLTPTAQSVIYCGEVGSGQAMKAINNIIYNINITALCEVLPMAVAAGLKTEVLAELVSSGSSRSFAADHFVPKMLAGQFSDDFPMGNAYKDIVNVQKMAVETKASMPVTNAMISVYQSALSAGFEEEPKHAMLKVYEQILGVKFRH